MSIRRTVRAHSALNGRERLARAVGQLPPAAQQALASVAERSDLPLVAGAWNRGGGGCLVANVVGALGARAGTEAQTTEAETLEAQTLDLRVLELIPELSSRDLNRLIVAWDDAALQEPRDDDAALRELLRDALHRAGVDPQSRGAAPSSTSTVRSSAPRTTVSSTTSPGE